MLFTCILPVRSFHSFCYYFVLRACFFSIGFSFSVWFDCSLLFDYSGCDGLGVDLSLRWFDLLW